MSLPTSLKGIRWRNRLIGVFPFLAKLNERRWILKYADIWRKQGWQSEPAPFFVRRAMILAEARAINAQVFVETGTLYGDTPWHFRHTFQNIHTIEVEPNLAQLARERFHKQPHIRVWEGDSASLLAEVCQGIEKPCVIYLDGHYSHGITGMGEDECPAISELRNIFETLRHPFRIVIDDARLFGTNPAYPSIKAIEDFLAKNGWSAAITVENDAILIRP
ncbi:hypothetical protein OKA05_27500 [Luteolibacter arcticus]|uniref:Class I SAM-dependent methyltransferase n=1 Tax=Luteolibacter arcticus TaxID=1581411 RepID=A0ABT3GS18_9BACT|nr:hypothetical protein [Luteolibacter arcticus]MCW1926331.1 hypothetical protein [Luteolibacter arcticus]